MAKFQCVNELVKALQPIDPVYCFRKHSLKTASKCKDVSTEKEVREKFEKKALMEAEEETWKLIKDSDNKDDLEYFIKQFPNSPYTIPAKLKLNQLNKN